MKNAIASWIVAAVVAALLTAPAFAGSGPSLIAYEQSTHHGPEKAAGAVIWLHGWCPGWEDCTGLPPPHAIKKFGREGWDIYRLIIPTSKRNHDNVGYLRRSQYFADLAIKHAKDLRGRGYDRIVLSGQSGGAMGVIYAGTLASDIQAIIAFAPCCGTGARRYTSVSGLYKMFRAFKVPRAIVFFFDDEKHAPDELAENTANILDGRKTTYRIYDRPFGYEGHGGGLSYRFSERFSDEIFAFATGDDTDSKLIKIRGGSGKSVEEIEALIEKIGEPFVVNLQQRMTKSKYYRGKVDGKYGPQTRRALVKCVGDGYC